MEPARSGLLNVDKPAGRTSHDVVAAVRRASGVRRVGHAGTLDPLATGVLVVAIGSATRVIDEVQSGRKRYRARARLGIETTTYDREGDVVAVRDPSGVDRAAVEAALEPLRGDIAQVPPMYAAVKHQGRRLYELAREGISVEREPRPVTVHRLALAAWDPPDLTLEAEVSKGTYVRALAHDLGVALGVGAHLVALVRTAVGPFAIEDATPLDQVVEAFADGSWPRLLHPLDAALVDLPALVVDPTAEEALRMGQQVDAPPPPPGERGPARAYARDGLFVALVRWDPVSERWQPDRVFPRP